MAAKAWDEKGVCKPPNLRMDGSVDKTNGWKEAIPNIMTRRRKR